MRAMAMFGHEVLWLFVQLVWNLETTIKDFEKKVSHIRSYSYVKHRQTDHACEGLSFSQIQVFNGVPIWIYDDLSI